ncbi:MAG: hypothetical protein ACOC9X_05335 [bacterium]
MAVTQQPDRPLTLEEWVADKLERRKQLIQELTSIETFLLEHNAIRRRACVSGRRRQREAHSPSAPPGQPG